MDFDPHTLHQIVQKIQQQMRCPQCGEKVPVELNAVRMTGDDFLLLQLKCGACDAYIVLHAALQGLAQPEGDAGKRIINVSSALCDKTDDVAALREKLEAAGGSFKKLFEGA